MNCRALCLLTQQLLSARLKKKEKGQDGGVGSHPSSSAEGIASTCSIQITRNLSVLHTHKRRDDTNVSFLSGGKASERLGKLKPCANNHSTQEDKHTRRKHGADTRVTRRSPWLGALLLNTQQGLERQASREELLTLTWLGSGTQGHS